MQINCLHMCLLSVFEHSRYNLFSLVTRNHRPQTISNRFRHLIFNSQRSPAAAGAHLQMSCVIRAQNSKETSIVAGSETLNHLVSRQVSSVLL